MKLPQRSICPNILIVEDNWLDSKLICDSLANAGYPLKPLVVRDGLEALALLRRESPFENHTAPDLVIVDLNLKFLHGPEIIQFIREKPEFSKMKIIVLSSSPENSIKTFAVQPDGYLQKSTDLGHYLELGKTILDCYESACSSRALRG